MFCQLSKADVLFPIKKMQSANQVFLSFCNVDSIVGILSVKSRLHINCGGKEETIDGVKFEGEEDTGEPLQFYSSETNWAFSNSGSFLDGYDTDYVARNSSALSMINSTLYETARISPMSLTYYVYCMAIGNYTIRLHFAEIMFTNDKNYSSLGRRIFDVYVQVKNDIVLST